MGCTGSKPHLLLTIGGGGSANNGNANGNGGGLVASPSQKGFILFNPKTLVYLRANEHDIKSTLEKRCTQKLSNSTVGKSSSSILGKPKKSFLLSGTGATSVAASDEDSSKQTSALIEHAVAFVMNYALNEFDLNSFSRSNHLSMKQIRKDIMKKSVADSSSYANTPFYKLALNTAIDEFGSYVKEQFIAINEFNAEKQQTKTNTSDAESKKAEKIEGEQKQPQQQAEEQATTQSATSSEEEAAEALKLKEALEVARQNFYKGKVSLVCLSKHGEGYVVKEMDMQQQQQQQLLAHTNALTTEPGQAKSLNSSGSNSDTLATTESAPKINVEDVDASITRDVNGDDQRESVSNMSVKSIALDEQSSTNRVPVSTMSPLDEFLWLRDNTDMQGAMRETLECIVRYSTRPSEEEETSAVDTHEAQELIESLLKSVRIIDSMRRLDDYDGASGMIDTKLVESVLNLDYVIDEFRAYLRLVRDEAGKRSGRDEYCKCLDEMNAAVQRVATSIEMCPIKLFTSKGLPPPRDSNPNTLLADASTTTREEAVKTTIKTVSMSKSTNSKQQHEKQQQTPSQSQTTIDIKKEIAFSILNVGEVLAKTIDYYSLPSSSNASESEELKELIKISEAQAAHERNLCMQQQRPPLQVSVAVSDQHEQVNNDEVKQEQFNDNNHTTVVTDVTKTITSATLPTTTSSSSALSSPTISTTSSAAASSSGSGSASPNNAAANAASPVHLNSDSVEAKSTTAVIDVGEQPSQTDKTNGLDYLVDHMSRDSNLNGAFTEKPHDEQQSLKVASSSSSDLIMTNSNSNNTNIKSIVDDDIVDDVINSMMNGSNGGSVRRDRVEQVESVAPNALVHEFITNIIENASKRLSGGSAEIEIEIEREQKPDVVVFRANMSNNSAIENSNKRISLDEELMYQLEDVDKKVKYMNETCSENEDDDDDEELNGHRFDDDSNLDRDLLDQDDDDKLFQPARRPAEIKSNVRRVNKTTAAATTTRRQVDLHEEIKQISTVIQDLVQTMNAAATPEKNTADLSAVATTHTPITSPPNGPADKSSSALRTSTSSIPVLRQRVLTKQKATNAIDESTASFKTTAASTTIESFVEFSSAQPSLDTSSSSAKFKSKLPVKK